MEGWSSNAHSRSLICLHAAPSSGWLQLNRSWQERKSRLSVMFSRSSSMDSNVELASWTGIRLIVCHGKVPLTMSAIFWIWTKQPPTNIILHVLNQLIKPSSTPTWCSAMSGSPASSCQPSDLPSAIYLLLESSPTSAKSSPDPCNWPISSSVLSVL